MDIGIKKAKLLNLKTSKYKYLYNVQKVETAGKWIIIHYKSMYLKSSYNIPLGSYELISVTDMYK